MQLYRVYVLPNPSFPFTITVGIQVTVRWQSLTHNQDRVVAVFRRKIGQELSFKCLNFVGFH